MPTIKNLQPVLLIKSLKKHQGVSLVELIVFIVVVSIALTALIGIYVQSASRNVDPIVRVRLLEAAQSRLEQIIALKYDESSPSGGIPACGSSAATALACTNTPDANMNDVDDFHNATDQPYLNYNRSVTVTTNGNNKLITVTVSAPNNEAVTLSAYRYNF